MDEEIETPLDDLEAEYEADDEWLGDAADQRSRPVGPPVLSGGS